MATPTSNSVPYRAAPLTGQNYIDALIDGYKWGSGGAGTAVVLTYSFPGYDSYWASDYYGGEPWDFDILNATQKAAATAALATWASVANVSFMQTADNSTTVGEIRFAWTGEVNEQAHAYTPGSTAEAGDVWLNYNADWSEGFGKGTYAFTALVHELGHALGLKHTFEAPNTLPSGEDGYHNSVMSYSAQAGNDGSMVSFNPTTPMLYDIAAIQYLYGANMSYNAGNTTYTFQEGQDYFQTLWDGGGKDTIVWQAATQSAQIDLRAGSWSDLGNTLQFYDSDWTPAATSIWTVAIAFTVTIENATGGGAGDVLTGNDAANVLSGNAGNDTLSGNGGNDTLNGGTGSDRMLGGTGNDIYLVNSASDVVIELSGQGTDLIKSPVSFSLMDTDGAGSNGRSVEKLTLTGGSAVNGIGNGLANVLTGNGGANTLAGNAGADTLAGGGGNDLLRGGTGNDTLTGGAGADIFRFDTALTGNLDKITDFYYVDDAIQLENSIFAKLTTPGQQLASANYRENLSGTAVDGNDFILHETDTGKLYYDADGSGASAAIHFATVYASGTTPATLKAMDFFVT